MYSHTIKLLKTLVNNRNKKPDSQKNRGFSFKLNSLIDRWDGKNLPIQESL